MLKHQIGIQIRWAEIRERLADDEGVSLVEGMVYAGAIAVAVVAIVAALRTWATGKVTALP